MPLALVKDCPPEPIEKPDYIGRASEIIGFLNAKTGKNYRARKPNGQPTQNLYYLTMRLKEGYTDDDCRSVIANRVRAWGNDDKMRQYLTPETIFRVSNFERYLGELENE
jgi:uncharacterized phage protein (TIGR02220 family)